jgi:hypothetical protein
MLLDRFHAKISSYQNYLKNKNIIVKKMISLTNHRLNIQQYTENLFRHRKLPE